MNSSKVLKNQDISGEIFAQEIFNNDSFKELFISFDRIQKDYRNNGWVIFEHILIDKPVTIFEELPEDIKKRINKLTAFSKFLAEKSETNTNIVIDLFFSKTSKNKDDILLVGENNILYSLDIKDYSSIFREINFYGEKNNAPYPYKEKPSLIKERADNSAFSLTQSLLCNDLTYGFNIDKILFDEKKKEAYIFEFLLCEEDQVVTPHTSHPNKYFNKNYRKFVNLFNFSQSINAPLYLLNYAKPETTHGDKVLWMKVLDVDVTNKKTPVLTQNKKTTRELILKKMEKKFLNKKEAKVQFGVSNLQNLLKRA